MENNKSGDGTGSPVSEQVEITSCNVHSVGLALNGNSARPNLPHHHHDDSAHIANVEGEVDSKAHNNDVTNRPRDSKVGLDPSCVRPSQSKVSTGLGLDGANDTKEQLVQQEGYIAMSENGEHCLFIPAEQVEEEITDTAADGTVMLQQNDGRQLLILKQEDENNIDVDNVTNEQQVVRQFTNQQNQKHELEEMPTLSSIQRQNETPVLHHEGNPMLINFHHAPQSVVPEQTPQIGLPFHHQYYNYSQSPVVQKCSPRANPQMSTTISQPYPTQVRTTYVPPSMMYAPRDDYNIGSSMPSCTNLPPVSSLRPVIENHTLNPMNNLQQAPSIGGGITGAGDSSVMNCSPSKDGQNSGFNYSHQYLMKAPLIKSISPLKPDMMIQQDRQQRPTKNQVMRPLYRTDGRPSQGLVQQVLQVFKMSSKTEMQPYEVYNALEQLHPLYTTYSGQKKKSWMSSVRHALTHPAFKSRRADDRNAGESHRKGCFWSINEEYDPYAPMPKRQRKVQRTLKANYNQPLQYMMMPMVMSNEQMMGPQTTTAFNPMMSGKVMPAYIMSPKKGGPPHMFMSGDNSCQSTALNMQPQPVMVTPFANVNTNSNMVNFGQFGNNYPNQITNSPNMYMEQMKDAEIPLKTQHIPASSTQVTQQQMYPFIHHENDQKMMQLKPEQPEVIAKPSGMNPTGVNPAGMNLAGVNPTGVHLTGVNPTGINLTGVNPVGVNSMSVNPTGVNLSSEAVRFGNENQSRQDVEHKPTSQHQPDNIDEPPGKNIASINQQTITSTSQPQVEEHKNANYRQTSPSKNATLEQTKAETEKQQSSLPVLTRMINT